MMVEVLTKYKDETAPKMFSLQRDKQSFIVKRMTEQWLPKGGRILDVTAGTLGYWWNLNCKKYALGADGKFFLFSDAGKYDLVCCDAIPSLPKILEEMIKRRDTKPNSRLRYLPVDIIHKKDLLIDDYSDLGKFDAEHFDPPYKIGESPFDPNQTTDKDGVVINSAWRGARSWGTHGLDRFTANLTVADFNDRVRALNKQAPWSLKKGGLLFVKVMNQNYSGKIVDHANTCKNELSNFELKMEYIYERMGQTNMGGTIIHGYWLVFKVRNDLKL